MTMESAPHGDPLKDPSGDPYGCALGGSPDRNDPARSQPPRAGTRSPVAERLLPTSSAWRPPGRRAERRGWLQLVLGAVVVIVVQVVAQVVGGLVQAATVPSASKEADQPLGMLVSAVVVAVLASGGYWCVVRLTARRRVHELARDGAAREMGAGLGTGALLVCVVVGVMAVLGAYRVVEAGWDAGVVTGLAMGISAGFAEEILFRGLLLRLLEDWLGTWWALAATSALFGAVHLVNPHATAFGAVAIMLEAGVLLGACYLLTRRLWLAIGVHAAWNFVQGGVFGSDVSGTGSGRGLIEAQFVGPELLTGGSMGLEGSLVAVVVCTGAGVAMLLLARRRGLIVAPLWRRRRQG